MSLSVCCILLIHKKIFTKALDTQMNMMTATREAELQRAEMVLEGSDLFPIPDYGGDADSDMKILQECRNTCVVERNAFRKCDS